ncbi:MAG: hypothetical protein GX666_01780 [Tissierellia bacterium]|nr:hypothetical protein [Tissierellia bacterium]
MNSKIKDLRSLFEYVKKNEKNIYKKIFQTYGLPTSKIKNLPKEENELLLISTGINMSVEEKLSKLIGQYEYDNATIYNKVKDDFEFNSKVGFFEVLNHRVGGSVHVVDLKSSVFETLVTDSDLNLEKGDLLFGLSFFDFEIGDTILYSNFIVLTEEERIVVDGIYDEYFVDDDTDVFFDNVVLPRLMKNQLQQIDELFSKHTLSMMENYDQVSIYNFFKHFSDTIKYALFSNEEINIYNLDYYDFLMKETESGNFIVEGDLEIFIDMLEFLMTLEARRDKSKEEVLKSIIKCKENILVLKNNLSLKYPVTPLDLVNAISDNELSENNEISGILTMGFYMDELSNQEEPKLTNKTRRLSAKSLKKLMDENVLIKLDSSEHSEENAKELIQFAVAILLSNGLAGVKEDDEIYLTNRFAYFVISHPDEVVANFLTAIFREDTLRQYIGRKNDNYKKLLDDLIKFINTLDNSELIKTQGGKKMLNILEIIGLVKTKIVEGEEYFEATILGEIYNDYLKSKAQKGKVLQMNSYKK